MNRIIAVSAFFIVLGVTTFIFFEKGYLRLNYPGTSRFPVRGIDISHHQSAIDWPLLDREELDFAFIKATEGGDHKDTKFEENWNKAHEIGLVRGAYHFFTFCKTGYEQAMNYIDTVPVEENTLPPVIDLEFGGNCSARPSKEEVLEEIAEFSNIMESRYGKRPLIYATRQSYEEFLAGELPGQKIWIRDIYSSPRLPDKREWSFWQYANRGRLIGIEGFVDLNVFNGDREEFMELVDGKR
ncbi:MAG: GH25 family lysozyme [Deltaproteobacteria bacterium]